MLNNYFWNLFTDCEQFSPTDETSFFSQICEKYGLTSVSYIAINLPVRNKRNFYFNSNYSNEWVRHYESKDYIKIDPVIKLGFTGLMPIDWSDQTHLSEEQKKFVHDAWDHELGRRGLSFPIRGRHGETAIFSFNCNRSDREWQLLKANVLREFRILADLFHTKIVSAYCPPLTDKAVDLNERQIECLRWSAEGKSHEDIAALLNITVRTVRFHLENARQKLGCINTTHAVSAALRCGYI